MQPKFAYVVRSEQQEPRQADSRANFASEPDEIEIVGWERGLQKVQATRFLQQISGLTLSECKAMVDVVLEGSDVRVQLLPNIKPRSSIAGLRDIGLKVRKRRKPQARMVYHIVPHHGGWAVQKAGSRRASIVLIRKSDAVQRGRQLARSTNSGQLIIHGRDGRIQTRRTYG